MWHSYAIDTFNIKIRARGFICDARKKHENRGDTRMLGDNETIIEIRTAYVYRLVPLYDGSAYDSSHWTTFTKLPKTEKKMKTRKK